MRLSKAWIVASKDFKTFYKRASILYSIIGFDLLVSIGMPVLIRAVQRNPGVAPALPILMNSFSFWFVIGATVLPVGIASFSLVGEKVQKSLEPLLATPTTDEEILAGKSIAAIIPALASIYIGAIVFMVLADAFTFNYFKYNYFPNWNIAILLLLLSPLACLMSVGVNVLISSRANDTRAAQQVGSLMVLPFGLLYVLSEIKVVTLDANTLLIIAAVLAALDVFIFYLVKATFQREEILTKWT